MNTKYKETFIVVGACGFLGSALCKYLLERGCIVIGLDINLSNTIANIDYRKVDILDYKDIGLMKLFDQYERIDGVISFAAQIIRLAKCLKIVSRMTTCGSFPERLYFVCKQCG